jgi:hypothetical protein
MEHSQRVRKAECGSCSSNRVEEKELKMNVQQRIAQLEAERDAAVSSEDSEGP